MIRNVAASLSKKMPHRLSFVHRTDIWPGFRAPGPVEEATYAAAQPSEPQCQGNTLFRWLQSEITFFGVRQLFCDEPPDRRIADDDGGHDADVRTPQALHPQRRHGHQAVDEGLAWKGQVHFFRSQTVLIKLVLLPSCTAGDSFFNRKNRNAAPHRGKCLRTHDWD